MMEEVEPTCNPLDPLLNKSQENEKAEETPQAPPHLPVQGGPAVVDPLTADLVRATQYGVIERVQEVIEGGYDVNKLDHEGVSLLHWAGINNRTEIVDYFMSKGAVVDRLGGHLNSSALHWATRQGHLPMVVQLMSFGADPSLRDGEGCSCIHLAAQFGHTAIVAYLIAKGQDVDMGDKAGMTPLIWASFRVFGFDPARLLLTFGANINKADNQKGNTALHWACVSGNHTVIKMLLAKGADLHALNLKGESPLDVAISQTNAGLVKTLRSLQETAISNKNSVIGRWASDRAFRKKVLYLFPFITLFIIGYIPEMEMIWQYKLLLFIPFAVIGRWISTHFLDEAAANTIPVALYLSTKFWMYYTWFFFCWPYLGSSPYLHLSFAAVTVLLTWNFYKAWKGDPGYLKSNREDKIRTILELAEVQSLKLDQFCSTCLIHKPLRSKHCAICNKCVAKFDHHCPWIDNCVGADNHKYFMSYLFFLMGMIGFCLYGCYSFWAAHFSIDFYEDGITGIIWKAEHASPWVAWIGLNAHVHMIWVTSLFCCQLYQISWLAMTTNERMNNARYSHFQKMEKPEEKSSDGGNGHSHGGEECHGHGGKKGTITESPFSRGPIKNVVDVMGWKCCGLCRPLQTDWSRKFTLDDDPRLDFQSSAGRENYQYV